MEIKAPYTPTCIAYVEQVLHKVNRPTSCQKKTACCASKKAFLVSLTTQMLRGIKVLLHYDYWILKNSWTHVISSSALMSSESACMHKTSTSQLPNRPNYFAWLKDLHPHELFIWRHKIWHQTFEASYKSLNTSFKWQKKMTFGTALNYTPLPPKVVGQLAKNHLLTPFQLPAGKTASLWICLKRCV